MQGALCRGKWLVQNEEGWGRSGIVAVQGNACNLDSGYMTAAFFFSDKNEDFPSVFRNGKYLGNSAVGTFLSEHGL